VKTTFDRDKVMKLMGMFIGFLLEVLKLEFELFGEFFGVVSGRTFGIDLILNVFGLAGDLLFVFLDLNKNG
jgi:hypothetical protein